MAIAEYHYGLKRLAEIVLDEVREMLEIIGTNDKARKFAYLFILLTFAFGMTWALPDLINALKG